MNSAQAYLPQRWPIPVAVDELPNYPNSALVLFIVDTGSLVHWLVSPSRTEFSFVHM